MEPKLLKSERFVGENADISYRYVYSDTEFFRPHYHDYYEIFLMLNGTAYHYINNAKFKIKKGSLVFIRPHDIHDYISINNENFSFLNITFKADTEELIFKYLGNGFPAEQLNNMKYPPVVELSSSDINRLEGKMSNIRAIDPKNFDEIQTQLKILIFEVLTKYFYMNEKNVDTVPFWLDEMCEKMSKNGNFKNDTEFFFSLTDKTREHVSRSMKKYMGMTVTEYINSLRLNYIANMLQNSNHSITDIVFESGFNNNSWASELFKEKYGMTMSEFRKQLNKSDLCP